ncbi:hypothetical protein [Paraburkholderia bannensis]|uniref:hypothetical protein n=1 Tax=Paraburkholderia bannensis TaxID=765414 RepID=UPI002AB6D632|nr:hypothetical protein [Paraburkholderia bannensis]
MTVESSIQDATYDTDGVTLAYPVPFYFLDDDHVYADFVDSAESIASLVLGTDFSLSGAGDEDGGTLTLTATKPVGYKLHIYRIVPVTQETAYQQNSAFPAKSTETALDKLTMIAQQNASAVKNSIRYPLSEYGTDGTLPVANERAGSILAFDSNGVQFMAPMPTSVGAGDLKNESWTDGTDFTSGASTSVTLSRSYSTKANLGTVVMAGVAQDPASYSLNGNTLQFDAIIPLGIARIWCVGGTTLSVYAPSPGSITDEMVSDDAAIDSSKIAYSYDSAFFTPRSLKSRLSDAFSVMETGAKGDGSDEWSFLQEAIDYTVSKNRCLRIPTPPLYYGCSKPLVAQFSNASGGLNSSGRRPRIEGDGQECTLIWYTGTDTNPVLSVIGGGDYVDLITVKGFRIARSFVSPAGVGFKLQKTIRFLMEDLAFVGFGDGYQLTDVNAGKLLKVNTIGNNNGFTAQQGTGGATAPNLIEWDTCAFGNQKSAGSSLLETINTFRNCVFEGNGDGTKPIITLTYGGGTGNASAQFVANYFEGNWGPYDIYVGLQSGMPAGNFIADGNVFDKVSSTKYVGNHIFFDASALGASNAPFNIQARGNGFYSNGQAPDSGAIVQAPGASGYYGFRSNDLLNDNTYSNPSTQGPAYITSALVAGRASAYVSSAGALSNNVGISACSKTGTGQYTLTIPQLNSGACKIHVTPSSASSAQASAIVSGAQSVIVQTANGSGSAADLAFFVEVKMG